MNLKLIIKKVLMENFDNLNKINRMEKSLSSVIKSLLNKEKLTDNFYDVAVDIYITDYGRNCHVTFLMKEPFKNTESEYLHHVFYGIKDFLKKSFSNYFDAGISNSTSTIDNYQNIKWFYDMKKK